MLPRVSWVSQSATEDILIDDDATQYSPLGKVSPGTIMGYCCGAKAIVRTPAAQAEVSVAG
jgi:hypothetical protein